MRHGVNGISSINADQVTEHFKYSSRYLQTGFKLAIAFTIYQQVI